MYLGFVLGLTACFTALSWLLAREAGVDQIAILAALSTLAIFPLSELSIQIVNALVISLLPADPLPKLDFRAGIPGRGRHPGGDPDDADGPRSDTG